MSTQLSISEVTAQQAGVEEIHSDAPTGNNRSHEGASSIADTDVPRLVKQDGLVDKLKHFFTFRVGHIKRKRTKKEKIPKKPVPKTPLDQSYEEAKSKYGGGWVMSSHLAR